MPVSCPNSQLSTLTLMEQIGALEASTERQRQVMRELTAVKEILATAARLPRWSARGHRRGAGQRSRDGA